MNESAEGSMQSSEGAHDQHHGHKQQKLFVDNVAYDWNEDTITGTQLRVLASIPEDVQIFHKIPGHPDGEVKDNTVVDLTLQKGPDRFSTQAAGSQAG